MKGSEMKEAHEREVREMQERVEAEVNRGNLMTMPKDVDVIEEVGEENVLEISQEINGSRELYFDTENVTGNTISRVKDRYFRIRKKKSAMIAELDDHYYVMFAEEMTGVPYETLMALKAKDFKAVVSFVRDFLQED